MKAEVITKMKGLDSYLKNLIASKEGIPVEKVSVDYIHEQRQQRMYNDMKYDISSSYGGYDLTGLKVLTGREIEAIEERANAFLSSF